jgi:hypothetical protein
VEVAVDTDNRLKGELEVIDIGARLTQQGELARLADAIRRSAYVFESDDLITIATAASLQVVDKSEYAQGHLLLEQLTAIDERITCHYSIFDKPLNFLISVVREDKSPQLAQVGPVKRALASRLGIWKNAQDARDRVAREAAQAAADAVVRAAQAEKAAVLKRIADAEKNPKLAEAFRAEAEVVAKLDVHAPPVAVDSGVPAVGGHTQTRWKCRFDDIDALLKAYVEGKCNSLDVEGIKAGLQESMDIQAGNLLHNLGKAFPGCVAVPVPTAVTAPRRRKK